MAVTINGSAGVTTNSGAVYDGIQRGTAVTASGTSVDFTSIPSWVKRITVMFNGVSTSGTSQVQIQIGSGSVTTSGYLYYGGYGGVAGNGTATVTTGFGIEAGNTSAATTVRIGTAVLTLVTSNTWLCTYSGGFTNSGSNYFFAVGSGNLALSGALDRVRITTVNGTDTFDAGTINILFE